MEKLRNLGVEDLKTGDSLDVRFWINDHTEYRLEVNQGKGTRLVSIQRRNFPGDWETLSASEHRIGKE